MIKVLFVVLAGVFGWLLWQGLRTGEIMGQGWMNRIRYYCKDEQPVAFYVTAASYVLALLICGWVLLVFPG